METTGAKLQISSVLNFILAGNSTFTILNVNSGNRFTYKVTLGKEKVGWPRTFFVKLLTGSNNETDYTLFGTIRNGKFSVTRSSRISNQAPSVKVFETVLGRLQNSLTLNGIEVWHEGRCGRCGRVLTVPESCSQGFGPECITKMAA